MSDKKLRAIVEKNVPGLFSIIFIFALIEFGILIVCIILSSNQDIVKVYNSNNELVYENVDDIIDLKEFKRVYGIKNFKNEGFVVSRIRIDNEFPTRAWIALSICVPLVLIFFVVFVVKVFADVFHPKRNDEQPIKTDDPNSDFEENKFEQETKFEKLFTTLGRLNIYSLGSTIILIAFLYWMVPDLLIFLGKISYKTLSELKWIILGVVLLGGIFFIFKAYLSYKTKNEILKQQADIQKNRDKLAIEAKTAKNLLEDKSI